MTRPPIEPLVNSSCRLDMLSCLHGERLTQVQVSERTGHSATIVAYHLGLLEAGELVEAFAEEDQILYTATLDRHPPWVAEAVNEHGKSRTPALPTAVRMMIGMKCDACERLLRYRAKIVALYDETGTRQAKVVEEGTPGSDEASRFRVIAKYHRDCYIDLRLVDPSLPPLED